MEPAETGVAPPLKAALDQGGYDVIFGAAGPDEEKSRDQEGIFSIRSSGDGWDPRRQRLELWRLDNTRLATDQSARIFPLSNRTEADIWSHALPHPIPLAPYYLAQVRPVVEREGYV